MLIKTMELGILQANCYIVTDENTLDCAVIDPGGESWEVMDYIEENHLHCRAILLTHGHADHCLGAEGVQAFTGATIYMSEKDINLDIGDGFPVFEVPDDTETVEEGDVIRAGSLSFAVMECPGHSPGSLTFRIENCLFTGDTLFRLSCGRYDLPGSSLRDLVHSLERLRDLDGDWEIYPGHAENSTLDFERRLNPYLMNPRSLQN